MKFSERLGIKPVRSIIQVDSMDSALKNGLWNVFYENICRNLSTYLGMNSVEMEFFTYMFRDYFKEPIDKMSSYSDTIIGDIRRYYLGSMVDLEGFAWYEVYDFIEYMAQNYPFNNDDDSRKFREDCNSILERELSGYRFVDNYLVRVTDETEIGAIETVLNSGIKINYAKQHIERALSLMADKQAPDYRNSIKESISAVESIGNTILGKSSSSLGEVLKLLEKQTDIDLHPALKKAFLKLYGYTSDASGIRHSLTEESTLGYEDAKYMLVACSAFVNYLVEKAIKADISLN
ncbi:AbiJ-NTD4 domain-containing protein [Priestia megaterium]|uniref:AbiJ-NTD4 domain-containing protein n=1 Tax=Priestia megaterium TaxID=1404 RepID=UPI001FB2A4BD|nr:hypothetical protein [Priestia megaterium]